MIFPHGILILLSFYSVCHGKVDIQNHFQICDRNSADVNDCLVDAIQDALNKLGDGLQELDVPSTDPYVQQDIKVEYNNNQITAKMNMKNVRVKGLTHSKVHNARLRADDDRFYLEVDLSTPNVLVTGQYYGEGRYNALHIETDGDFNCSMNELVYTWKLEGTPQQRNETTVVKITSFYMRPDVSEMRAHVSNIFPNSPELTQIANDFVNRNWRILYREMLPYAQGNWNKIGVLLANKIFLKVPYDELFPAKS